MLRLRFQKAIPSAGRLVRVRAQSSMVDADSGAKLRVDVRTLGSTLGGIIQHHDKDVFEAVEKLRPLGRQWRKENPAALDEMVQEVKKYSPAKLLGVARAFTHFLSLSNSAENHHRIRRLRDGLSGTNYGLSSKTESCAGAIDRLLNVQKVSKADILSSLSSQSVEIVLTAHPTEVNRKTILQKHQRIKVILDQMGRPGLIPFEEKRLSKQLHSEILSIWESDELKRSKPTPVDEAKSGLSIVEEVLWFAVPDFLRKLDDIVVQKLGKPLPLDVAPLKVASWMGGDRDGNPNVTPAITFEVSMLSRLTAAKLFKKDLSALKEELSICSASAELTAATDGAKEPYRVVLAGLETKLQVTIDWLEAKLAGTAGGGSNSAAPPGAIHATSDLMHPLLMLHESLSSTGHKEIADGPLVDTIRRLAAFGLSLMPLDIRQESTRHTEALSAVTKYLGSGSYGEWDEARRRKWLEAEISSNRPLLPRGVDIATLDGFSPTVVDTLKTFELAASLGPGSLGAYVISQCQQASDVLAVVLLQRDAGVNPAMRVVPLFETLDDLERAADTVEALFSMPVYKKHIQGKHEIMVGYSDSAKDAGRLAASWAQYNAQEAMIEVSNRHGVETTFFHGKGGTVGRGGNPALYRAILAHPPNTINGRFRVTEQGEMITQNFGQLGVAERTFDLFTAGVLAERFEKRPSPKKEWRDAMTRLGDVSCKAYRKIVRETPQFVPYFRAATPELELAALNIGSRPAKRNPKGGVESLRAIPWVFAWTQTRLNLPAWLGVGEAFNKELQSPEGGRVIKDMYANWPWFNTLVDLLEMILVKSEERIAANYDKQLVTDKQSLALGDELRSKLRESAAAVLAVSGHSELQANNKVLLSSMAVRNPYVDPLNIIQVELLLRLRSDENKLTKEELKTLHDALLVTINGVANGMRNSG